MKPKVSIIVPVYNVEKYLDRCLQSLISQTLKDIEIILVDDGSLDNCPAICDKYAENNSNIKVIHKKNAGLGMACNSGIEVASGDYIAFLDSDDWVEAEMYKTMVETAIKYNAQMVFTGLQRVDKNGNISPMYQSTEFHYYHTLEQIRIFGLGMIASPPEILQERQVMMSAKVVLYNREMIKNHGIRFNSEREIISEDLFFNLDCLQHVQCVVELPKTFYNYYINISSLSQSYRPDRFEKNVIMFTELLKRYNNWGNELKIRAIRMIVGYTRTILRQLIYNENLSWGDKRNEFMKISKSPIWKVFKFEYPTCKMPLVHRVVFKSIYTHNFTVLWSLLVLEKFIKGKVY